MKNVNLSFHGGSWINGNFELNFNLLGKVEAEKFSFKTWHTGYLKEQFIEV